MIAIILAIHRSSEIQGETGYSQYAAFGNGISWQRSDPERGLERNSS